MLSMRCWRLLESVKPTLSNFNKCWFCGLFRFLLEIIKKLNVCTIQSEEKYIISCKEDISINDLVNTYKNYVLKSDFYNFDCDEGSIFVSKRRLFETK